jgi:ubiquinone/menaquinone biosynthesis C-methylase UbiE
MEVDFNSINKAFTKQSYHYDKDDEENAILQWMRKVVRGHVLKYLKKDGKILELNAGTGLDALYFGKKGYRVHATDLAEGMVKEVGEKIKNNNLERKISYQQCSYTELDKVNSNAFDYVFSNFGGLNCIPDLHEVIKNLPSLLSPGAYITFVIMPRVCPWELSFMLRGNFRRAFRRYTKGGAKAHLEGEYFQTYYFAPCEVEKKFGQNFKKIALQGLASISPPPHNIKVQERFPKLYNALANLDEKLSFTFPFNKWADHYILTMQYQPELSK